MNSKTNNTKKKYIRNVAELLKYVWKFAPELFFVQIIMIGCQVVVNVLVYVSMLKTVIDAIAEQREFSRVVWYVLWVGAWQILSDVINNLYNNYINRIARLKIHKGVHDIIFEKVQGVDLEKYDDTDFYNDYIWALEKADTEILNSYDNLFRLLAYSANAVTLFSVTLIYDKYLLLFVIIPLIINVWIGNYISRLDYSYEQEANVIQRKGNYCKRIFYLKDYAKELKLYPVGKLLRRNFEDSVEEEKAVCRKFGFRFIWTGTINDSLSSIFDYVLLCIYMAYRAIVQGAYTVGTCAAMINAVGNMSYALENVFRIIPKIKKNGMFAEKILYIMNYSGKIEKHRTENSIEKEFRSLELKNVSFAYSGADANCLNKIEFHVNNGEKIAIVGRNGAGKTTLIKLLMRYYDVSEGEILYNGVNIKEYSTDDYRAQFATIFQDFQTYAVKLQENVCMEQMSEDNRTRVENALKDSTLDTYLDQMDCSITKEFDEKGLVLSGGQKQKLAIARALYRDSSVVIMDEASSALDPISEAEINRIIMEQLKDKSIIIISHRLATIKHVDRICFMENGNIIESGTHEELMKLDGKYAEMYRIQAEQYIEE